MRDGEDSNITLYYDDVFKNGIPIGSFIHFIFNAVISWVNIFLIGILFYAVCIRRSYHKNLR